MPKITLTFSDAPIKPLLDVDKEYTLRVKSATIAPAKNGQSNNLNIEFVVEDHDTDWKGEYTVYKTFNLQPQSLWNLRNFLNIMEGEELYKDNDVDIDTDELVDRTIGATMMTNVYQGKESSQPDTFFTA